MINTANQPSFYFHDYETFGVDPALDRPAQFAGVRTDLNFNIIEDPLVIYCKPAQDYLPDPTAVLVTGILPQQALAKGVCEAEFIRQIHHAFSQPNTCIVGYNNIRFDDEVTRNLLYRNFYDPYSYCWQNKNSRWDLLDVVRACYALRPDGVNWPVNDEGLPSFRLEHLTKTNQIEHEHAHDAMSDVYATIAIAKRLKEAQPKLFDYFYTLRNKNNVADLIDIVNLTPIIHVSGMLGAARGNISLFSPLAWHPTQRNAVMVCDLMGDIDTLLDLSVDEINDRLYTKTDDLMPGQSKIPLKLIHTNKCPIVAPAKTLLASNAERFNIDTEKCSQNHQKLLTHQKLIQQKIQSLLSIEPNYPSQRDVDLQIYQGFFNQRDKSICETIRTTPVNLLDTLSFQADDARLNTLFFRYKARNYPEILNESESLRWKNYCQDKFNNRVIEDYVVNLENLVEQYAQEPAKRALLKGLYDYCHYLVG